LDHEEVDVIAVAVENRGGISSVSAQGAIARHQGAHVGRRRRSDARDFFVNQATAEGIGNALTDERRGCWAGAGHSPSLPAR
jgi:rhamnose transport system permease protein